MPKQGLEITRQRVIVRAKYGWPRKSVPFDKQVLHQPDGYRTNAPGFISMCYDIPISMRNWGGANIVTLLTDGWMYEIDPNDLRPGDALGYLGPDAMDSDDGVIVLFEKWLTEDPNYKLALTWAHLPVVGMGPDIRGQSISFKWHAYRYKHIVD